MTKQICVLCDKEADQSKEQLKQFRLKVVHADCLQEFLANCDQE